MQVTKRLFMMNALAMLGAFVFTLLAAIIFLGFYPKVVGTDTNLNEVQRVLDVQSGFGELTRMAASMTFEELLEDQYQQELSDRVRTLGGNAVIVRNRNVVYSASPMSSVDIERSLLLTDQAAGLDTLELGGTPYAFARTDYEIAPGERGVLLLLAPIPVHTNVYLIFGLVTVGVFVLTFLLFNLGVSYWFSRTITAPVSRLREAAARIREGDLSRGIAEEGEGEVLELSRTLELMRIKLKESIELQEKYDENRSFLVSSISHDLKTPMTSIKGYIEGILDGVAQTPEKLQQYLETARAKTVLVNAMIDDLLLYSKLDLNQLSYHMERTDLVSYFQDCILDYQYEYSQAGKRLRLHNELNGSVSVRIDRERMKRVVQNILDNARNYIQKGEGEVVIILRQTPATAVIEIRDNGQGIPEADLPRIFERFYRVDPARNRTDGSGLGLAIAKQIVEGHEGKIWALSKVGQGTRMMISLRMDGQGRGAP
ncbi:sensor histidine kinase [Paenibacillus daejeonensis]|uniref:sensor histidine kinase n=1 Tax=Paenibacillus daejeonensis TaxID=135193 RepID=UPI000365A61E|nr:HAMP domain-containing sensor histidine kinase [Paenibacillus daejeonensis]